MVALAGQAYHRLMDFQASGLGMHESGIGMDCANEFEICKRARYGFAEICKFGGRSKTR